MDTRIIDITAAPVSGTVTQVEVSAAQSIIEVSAGTTQTDISVNHAGAGEQLLDLRVVYSGLGEEAIPNDGLFKRAQDYLSSQEYLVFLLEINRLILEQLSSTELVRFDTTALYLDAASTQETVSKLQGTALVELVLATENVTTQANYFREFVHNTALADNVVLLSGKGVVDTLTSQERLVFAAEKSLEDLAGLQEYRALATGKLIDPETFNVYDTAPTLTVGKSAFDTTSSQDTAYFALGVTLQDFLYPTDDILGEANIDDDQYASVGKNLVEVLSYEDKVDLLAVFFRTILENTTSTELVAANVGKNLQESFNLADTVAFGTEVIYENIAEAYDTPPVLDAYKIILETQEPYAQNAFAEDYLAKRLELAELVNITVGPGYVEQLELSEYAAFDVATSFSEQISSSELRVLSLGIYYTETLAATETVTLLTDWNRFATETTATDEQVLFDTSKELLDPKQLVELISLGVESNVYELIGSQESVVFEQAAQFMETLTVTDDVLGEANIDDDQYALVGKNIAEAAPLSLLETVLLAVLWLREYVDTASTTDSPYFNYSLVYSESTYFGENYLDDVDYVHQAVTLLESVSQGFGSVQQSSLLTSEQVEFLLSQGVLAFDYLTSTELVTFAVGADLSDTNQTLDNVYLSTGKLATDTFSLADAPVFLVEPKPLDTVVSAEALVNDIGTVLLDLLDATDDILGEANIDDDQYATVGKSVVEGTNTTDLISWLIGWNREFLDSIASSEALSSSIGKTAANTISSSEVVSFINGFSRTIEETLASSETVNFAIGRVASLLDSTTLLELVNLGIGNVNLDSLSSSETVSFLAGWGRVPTDNNVLTETLSKAIGDSVSETFTRIEDVRLATSTSRTSATTTSDTTGVRKTIGLVRTSPSSLTESKSAFLENYFQSQYAQTGYVGTNLSL